MSKATPCVIRLLNDELGKEKSWKEEEPIVEDKCKPMLRALVGEYAAEDEKKAEEKRAAKEAVEAALKAAARKKKEKDDYTDYLDGQMALKAKFAREETMHDLANKYLIHKHYWKIFVPLQIIVTVAALLAFCAAALDAVRGSRQVAFWLSLAAGALGFVAAFLNTIDRYLDWRTQGELHKKAASVYGRARSSLAFNKVEARTSDSTVKLPLSDYQKKLENLNDSIGELRIPYQISQAFAQVETFIKQQVHNMNNRYKDDKNTEEDLWLARDTNEFLVASYAIIANEITTDSNWPRVLPDPYDLAVRAHKKIQNRLLEVRFRNNMKLMSSLLIDYNAGDIKLESVMAAAENEPSDVEAGADADEESGKAGP